MKNQFPSRFIRAGAGAGKTSALIKTFFEFVDHYKKQNKDWPKIVITTFTRKATQEVKERLLLQALALEGASPGLSQTGDLPLFQYINKKSMVHISTIHGVLSLLLSRNHDLLGLPSDLRVSDHKNLYKIYYRELKFIFKADPSYLELLEHYTFKDLVSLAMRFHESSSEQAIHFVDKNILLDLRRQKIKKAQEDLHFILQSKSMIQGHKSWGPYFNFIEIFYSALKEEKINFDILNQIFADKPKKPSYYQDKPIFNSETNEKIAEYFSSDSSFMSSLDSDEFISIHQAINQIFYRMALDFHHKISAFKIKSGQISISDLETLSLRLIQEHPEAVQNFSDQYQYFMVDEYQDTSPLQVKILNALIGEKSQFTVGDPQQSIYLFRGARSEVFLDKQVAAKEKDHELINLQVNYRSDHRLMHGLNSITQSFSNQFAPMEPKPVGTTDRSESPQVYYVKATDEYSGLVNHIQYLVQNGVSYGDICVLFNKNSDIFDFTKYALKYHIPIQSQIAAGFDQKREIIDLVAFLKFLVNPYDNLNLHILLRSPWFDINDSELYEIRQSDNQNLWTQLKQQKHRMVENLNRYLIYYYQNGVLEALEKFILDSDFLKSSLYLDPTGKREANIYKFIFNLKENLRLEGFILNDYLSAQFNSFQEDLSSNLNEAVALFNGNRVSVMTIHGAKGLQFKHVLLPGIGSRPKMTLQMQFLLDSTTGLYSIPVMNADQKLSWSFWGKQQRKSLNEKEYHEYERLFYVAITRAEKSISFIAHSKKPASGSWLTKLDWPTEAGFRRLENYSIAQLNYESELADSFNTEFEAISFKDKLNPNLKSVHQTVSITELISQDEASELRSALSRVDSKKEKIIENLSKAQKGTDLHRLFEASRYLAEEQVLNKATPDEKQALHWLFQIQDIPFRKILDNGFAEWGFGLRTQRGVLQGQIDLWASLGEFIYIVDYKTGSSLYSERALSQLQRYAECLKKMRFITNHHAVVLAVLYPFEQKTVLHHTNFQSIADI